jgi:hypothetical protein
MRIRNVVSVSLSVIACARPAAAQLAHASASTLGLGDNATASARAFAALSVNPAGLGMPGSGFSVAILPLQIRPGIDPVSLSDLKEFEGKLVPVATKTEWLSRVTTAGGETGSGGAELTPVAITFGRFGFQVSTLALGEVNLSPAVAELLLFGNAGRTGTPATLSLTGSSLDGFAVTTVGASLGFPIPSATGPMALGATLKYSIGHGVAVGRNTTGSLTADQISLDFPVVMTDKEDYQLNNGSGVGVDIGFQMKRGALGLGAALVNAVNTFKWDQDKLVFRPGTARLTQGGDASSNFDKASLSSAPAALTALIDDMKFDPTFSAGASYDVNEDLTVAADLRSRFGDGLAVVPKLHVGAGGEFRGLRVLHLRGGAAVITDGIQFGGGASLVLGPVSLTAAGAKRSGDLNDVTLTQFTLSVGGR